MRLDESLRHSRTRLAKNFDNEVSQGLEISGIQAADEPWININLPKWLKGKDGKE